MLADFERRDFREHAHELAEARQMQGAGPWQEDAGGSTPQSRGLREATLREAGNVSANGAMGQLELDLQNSEWRREINNSWLEFSRWGIQQIILISRLYYIKNPIARRLINIVAYYVMGRGIEISSTDDAVNDAIKDILEANKAVLGQTALADLVRKTIYDGNLFFVFFPDTQNTGGCQIRTIDAVEIQDIVTNPDDATEKWYFRRTWTSRDFDTETGAITTKSEEAWYPSIDYNPTAKPAAINNARDVGFARLPSRLRHGRQVALWLPAALPRARLDQGKSTLPGGLRHARGLTRAVLAHAHDEGRPAGARRRETAT
jgi:hypothetical protein